MTDTDTPEAISDDDLNDVQGAGSAPGKDEGRKIILAEEMESILKVDPSPKAHRIMAQGGDGSI